MKASRFIPEGSLIIKNEPLGVATFSHNRKNYCNYCLKSSEKLMKCGKCQVVYYCSQDCQKKDWGIHKKECSVYTKIGQNSQKITNQFMLVLRCFLEYKEKQENYCQAIDDMISNTEKYPEDKIQFFEEMALLLIKYLEIDLKDGIEKLLQFLKDFIARLLVNAFTIYNNDNDTIAAAVYSVSNFINHSCEPNAIAIYKGKRQFIYALKDIQENEEINISYCNYIKPFYDRHNYLIENYFFECQCKKCLKEQKGTSTTLICQNCKKDKIYQTDIEKFICQKCSKDFTPEEIKIIDQQINKLKKEMGTQNLENRVKSWEKIRELVDDESGHYHEVLEIISRMYVSEERYEEAYAADRVLLNKMKKWYMSNDPMIGWKYLELAKLASALTKYKKAKEYVAKGLKILDKYYLLEEMPDFKEMILDIQNDFQYTLNHELLNERK